MPTFICHFILPGRVPLLLLLPRRVVVAVVATATSFLCAVVDEPPSSFPIPFLFLLPIIACSVLGIPGGDAGDDCGVDIAVVRHSKQWPHSWLSLG